MLQGFGYSEPLEARTPDGTQLAAQLSIYILPLNRHLRLKGGIIARGFRD